MPDTTTTTATPPAGAPPKPKSPALSRPYYVLGAALIIGFVIEWLIHVPAAGFGYALAALVAAAGWLFVGAGLKLRVSLSAVGLLLCLAVSGAMVALRASPTLQAVNIAVGLGLILLAAIVYLPGRLSQLSITKYAVEGVLSAISALGQPFVLLFDDLPHAPADPMAKRGLAPAVGGLLIALPLVLLFGGLFYAADAVFAGYVKAIFRDISFSTVLGHLFLGLLVTWLVIGVLRHAFMRQPDKALAQMARPGGLRLGSTQAIVVLVTLNLLFGLFVAIQAVYLFGGSETLQQAGMVYSEYARKGFFELVAAAALVLSVVLAMDWLAWPRQGKSGLAINGLHAVLILFTLVICASAVQRMLLYQQAYGLTELRFYTTAFMVWLALVLIWLVVTVLRHTQPDRSAAGRRLFAFGALVAGLVLVLAVNIVNPDAVIARTNMQRSIAGVGEKLDTQYLGQKLSADAVPLLVAWLPALPDPCIRAELARELQQRDAPLGDLATKVGWRGLTLSHLSAGQALNGARQSLEQYAGACR